MVQAQKNFRELLQAKGVSLQAVANLMPASYWEVRNNIYTRGRATPQEAERIAVILGVSREELDAVLAETVGRPGERDPRGRKTDETAAAAECGGTTNGNAGDGREGNVALDSDGAAARRQPGGDGSALPAEASAGVDQPV